MILSFYANSKLTILTEKLETASGECRINMVMRGHFYHLQFAVNIILNLCSSKVALST